MIKEAWNKLLEALISVVPICVLVLVIYGLQFSSVFPSETIPLDVLITFLICVICLIIGMALFSLGSDVAMSKVGKYIGANVTKKRSLVFMGIVAFLLGIMITIAEPDLAVLSELLEDVLPANNQWIFKIIIGVGVGIFLVIGLFRIVFQKSLKLWLLFFYALIFGMACIFETVNGGDAIVSIVFDSGGVTTGPVTVPFLLTFGAGVASVRGGKNSSSDSFGVTALCSIGPILTSMILFLCLGNYGAFENIENAVNTNPDFIDILGETFLEVLIAILPICLFFTVYQFLFIKINKKELIRIYLGFVYTFLGLTIFLTSAKLGLIPLAFNLGNGLADPTYDGTYNYMIIILAIVIGLAVVLVEPGVHVLNEQVEEISGGVITKKKMLFALCIGVSLAIVLEVIRELCGGFSIAYYLVPFYIIALALTFTVPDIYTAVAFDSGGVASGTMSSCFVLPFILGISDSLGVGSGFGVIGLISSMPLICVQLLGLNAEVETKIKYKRARKRVKEADDAQIIHLGL